MKLWNSFTSFLWSIVMSPIAEVLAWVSTAVGGMLVSGAAGSWLQSVIGGAVLTLGLSPLGLQSLVSWRRQRFDDRLDARERIASTFAKDFLSSDAAAFEGLPRKDRVRDGNRAITAALDSIHRQVYDSSERVRVCCFRLATDGKMLTPVDSRGRADEPRSFDLTDERGTSVLKLLDGAPDSLFVPDTSRLPAHSGAQNRPYNTFIRLPIRSPVEAFGMLTLDSTKTSDLSERDAILLETYAAAIAFI